MTTLRPRTLRELEVALTRWLADRNGVSAEDLEVRAQAAALTAGYRLLNDVLAERGLDHYLDIATTIMHALAPTPHHSPGPLDQPSR